MHDFASAAAATSASGGPQAVTAAALQAMACLQGLIRFATSLPNRQKGAARTFKPAGCCELLAPKSCSGRFART